jgi:hypothetical protein
MWIIRFGLLNSLFMSVYIYRTYFSSCSSDSKCSEYTFESLNRTEEKPVWSITNDLAWKISAQYLDVNYGRSYHTSCGISGCPGEDLHGMRE